MIFEFPEIGIRNFGKSCVNCLRIWQRGMRSSFVLCWGISFEILAKEESLKRQQRRCGFEVLMKITRNIVQGEKAK